LALLDKLSIEMGEATLTVSFEDLDLDSSYESHFDVMCLWAVKEGLVSASNDYIPRPSHSTTSYLTLKSPCLTSLGIAVGALACQSMNGDIVLATAVIKHPGVSGILNPKSG
jgi:hypothetical protein